MYNNMQVEYAKLLRMTNGLQHCICRSTSTSNKLEKSEANRKWGKFGGVLPLSDIMETQNIIIN